MRPDRDAVERDIAERQAILRTELEGLINVQVYVPTVTVNQDITLINNNLGCV